jgi:2-polyprenyl-3-methyl-5-hydroxy-6-metoxy-1,4-benzoquinol methylase
MKATRTDRSAILQAKEFVWDMETETEVHGFVWPRIEKLLRSLKPESLLDLGCGNGALTAKVASLVPRCIGVDFSASGVEIASRRYPVAQFRCNPMSQSLDADLKGTFDIVIAVEVVEHLLLPRELFERAREALKPGGYLLVTTPYHGYLKNLALAFAGKFDAHWHPLRDYGHVKFFSEKTLGQLFTEQGFRTDHISRVGRVPMVARSMLMGGRWEGPQSP